MLEELLIGALIAGVGAPLAGFGMVRWRLRRRLRVAPRVRSNAPTVWLAPVSPPARQHRRLRDVAATARLVAAQAGPGTPVADLCADVERQAVEVEAHLVLAARVKRGSGPSRQGIVRQIDQLETLIGRLARAAVEARQPLALAGDHGDRLEHIAERLDALEDARRELASVERAAGLEA